jgi:aspartate/methionine/tyrosine aminotransferase
LPPRLSASATAIGASVFAELAPRIEARARSGGDLVALHIGDTHVAPPRAARFGRAEDAYDAALYRYGSVDGTTALRAACFEGLRARGRAGCAPGDALDPSENLLLGCGATHALFCAARAVLDAGDEVLVAAPYWPLSVGLLRAAGARPVEVRLTDRLYADPGADAAALFAEHVTPRTRALYLITPNNPDGKVFSPAHLAGVAELARSRDLWVFADEVYADYTYGAPHASIAALPGMFERTLTAYSFSKSYALAGARVGFVVGPKEAIRVARRVSTHTVFNVPVAAQRVAHAALEEGEAWIDAARAEYRAARDETVSALARTGARFHAPEGGAYVFADFAPVLGRRPLKALLERAIDRGVMLAPGDGFGASYATWARLCFTAVSRAELRAGLVRLEMAIADVV